MGPWREQGRPRPWLFLVLTMTSTMLGYGETAAGQITEQPIIVNAVKEIDARTAESVSASITPANVQVPAIVGTVKPQICSVCNQALQMAQEMYLREAVAGATVQSAGLPLFVEGICSDLKVDYRLEGLRCSSVKTRFEEFYLSQHVPAQNLHGSWCCGQNPSIQNVNVNVVNALRSCRSLFGMEFECAAGNSIISPAMLTSTVASDGQGLVNARVEVTKHHAVHMYESRWKKLFFSLLRTVKEEAKSRTAETSDPDIDETVGYYNFLHKDDMKTSNVLDHEARGLRVRLEEEKEKSEKGSAEHMERLQGKVEVFHKLLKSYTERQTKQTKTKQTKTKRPPMKEMKEGAGGPGGAGESEQMKGLAQKRAQKLAEKERGVNQKVDEMKRKIANLEAKLGAATTGSNSDANSNVESDAESDASKAEEGASESDDSSDSGAVSGVSGVESGVSAEG